MTDFHEITVLLVEDEPIARTMMLSILSKRYRNVIVANEGKEGLEQYQLHSPHIIVTDLEMPIMSGPEMIQKIRLTNIDIPIIVVSAYTGEEKSAEGVQDRLIKPVFKNDLYASIDKIISEYDQN